MKPELHETPTPRQRSRAFQKKADTRAAALRKRAALTPEDLEAENERLEAEIQAFIASRPDLSPRPEGDEHAPL